MVKDGETTVTWAPDGRMFIAQKAGQVRVLPAGAQASQTVQLLDISSHVNNYADHGLLGLAVDSSFATNHYLYLLYVYDANPINQTGPKTSRLSRVTVNPDNTASAETVLAGTSSVQPCPAAANTVDCIPADSTTARTSITSNSRIQKSGPKPSASMKRVHASSK